jgi:hypothetical protein
MEINDFLRVVRGGQSVEFEETMAVISCHYEYRPTEFRNGLQETLINPPGQNEGSCKIFAFALLNDLSKEQTLALFGKFYREDVLENPDGENHQNIRNFIRDGWAGIRFKTAALRTL